MFYFRIFPCICVLLKVRKCKPNWNRTVHVCLSIRKRVTESCSFSYMLSILYVSERQLCWTVFVLTLHKFLFSYMLLNSFLSINSGYKFEVFRLLKYNILSSLKTKCLYLFAITKFGRRFLLLIFIGPILIHFLYCNMCLFYASIISSIFCLDLFFIDEHWWIMCYWFILHKIVPYFFFKFK